MVDLDLDGHIVTLDNGKKIKYQKLLSTVPLDLTLRMVGQGAIADDLNYSSSHIIGIGLRGINPHDLKCWLYYPEDDCPFYRCTVFSHYAKANTPGDAVKLPTQRLANGDKPASSEPAEGPYWSLMFEVSESVKKPVDLATIVEQTIQGAINTELCTADAEIVSVYHRRLEHGYPTPHVKRDAALEKALPLLKAKDVWSRGRFGSYKYEVANQDHSCIIGVEAVDNMLFGTKEFCLFHPSLANERGQKNMDLKYVKPASAAP
jgi:protoporphyrinogen oxidase